MSLPDSVRDLRRAQILREARSIVAERGVQGLTFGALEKRLPFTRGVITYHFENKSEIVHAVLEEAIRDIHHETVAGVERAGSAADKVRAVVRAVVEGYLANVEAGIVLMSFWGQLRAVPELAEKNAAVHARYRAQAEALVRDGIASGEVSDGVDVQSIAVLMVGITQGIATQAYSDPDAFDVDAAIRAAGDAMVALLRA